MSGMRSASAAASPSCQRCSSRVMSTGREAGGVEEDTARRRTSGESTDLEPQAYQQAVVARGLQVRERARLAEVAAVDQGLDRQQPALVGDVEDLGAQLDIEVAGHPDLV